MNWFSRLLEQLFGGKKKRKRTPKAKAKGDRPVLQSREDDSAEDASKQRGVGNLDHSRLRTAALQQGEKELMDKIKRKVDAGRFELPHLPATSLALINLAGRPGVDVGRVVQLVSSDPSLASELLRVANSVLYAAHVPAQTLNEAVMRIGLRGLQTLIYSVSVKGTILKIKGLSSYSQEIWRQAFSVGNIARHIAPQFGMERERAFLIGLLHDVGKIALLAMLAKEEQEGQMIGPALVGRVFFVYHEKAGHRLATKWRLDEEIASVTGNHHNFKGNEEYGRSAAFASLAHKLDLYLSYDDEEDFNNLVDCEEFDVLGLDRSRRDAVLQLARRAFAESATEAREANQAA